MDKTSIKQQLKRAKEEFIKKDFFEASKLCKALLTAEPNNISGLILYGATLLEIPSKKDESIQYFQKVIDINPNNIFAWQGVEQYYEKCDRQTVCPQLFFTYANLLCLESDENKCKTRAKKAIELWKNYKTKLDVGLFVSTVLPKVETEETTPQVLAISRVLAEFPFTEETVSLDNHLEKIYLALCEDNSYDDRFEIYCKLIPVLKSKGKRQEIVDICEKMLSLYNNNATAINFYCESFISNYIKSITDFEESLIQIVDKMSTNIMERCDILLSSQPTNPNSLIAKSIALRRQNNFEDSRKLLQKVLQVKVSSWQSWFILTEIQLNIHYYEDVIRCVHQAKKIIKPTFSCYQTMVLWEIEAYCSCSKHYLQGRQLAIEILSQNMSDVLISCVIIASCNLGDQKTAKNYLNTLQNKCGNNDNFLYLEALYFSHFDQLDDALNCLKNIHKPSVDTKLLHGNILWKQNKFSEAGKLYLEASRIAPYRCDLITKLGNSYRQIKQLPTAIACYEKSIMLNPDNEETGIALSDLYLTLSKTEEQEVLLNFLNRSNNIKWSSLRLGLYYLKIKNYEKAVDNFQLATKYDPYNASCYECLGDALYARRSLIGAKLTYAKCLEINPTLLYPKLQIAKIEYLSGQFDASIQLYYNIINAHSSEFSVLLEASRIFLTHAKCIFDHQVNRSYELCKNVCEYLHKALHIDNRFALLWKLFGDLCMLVATMPEELSSLTLPWNIFDKSQENYVINKLQFYTYSRRCYTQALNVTTKRTSLNAVQKYIWHDLANCYLKHAESAEIDKQERLEFKSKAKQAIKKCLSLEINNNGFWNTMGLIETIDESENEYLSYICFVKSLESKVNAVAYNNLAVKCMLHNNVDLALEACNLSQCLDPTLINSWIVQGLLTRYEDPEKSLEILYHSTTLGVHEESICNFTELNFISIDPNTTVLKPTYKTLHCIDVLTWLTSKNPKHSWGHNALSILFRHCGLYRNAVEAAKKAEKCCEPNNLIGIQRNLAFSLLKADCFQEAMSIYQELGAKNTYDKCCVALALYKTDRYQEAYTIYESVTKNITDNVIVSSAFQAMAIITFGAEQDYEKAKILFLKSIQNNKSNVQALLATFALGIVIRDINLSKIVLRELFMYKDDPVYMKDIIRFIAYFYYMNRQPEVSIRLLSRYVHSHPENPHLYVNLGYILMCHYMANEYRCKRGLVAHLFECAAVISNKQGDLDQALVLTSICNLFEGDLKTCLKNVLKGIHMYPMSSDLWTVLLNAIYCRGNLADSSFLKQHITFVINSLQPSEHLKVNLLKLETHIP
ncbi:tetratricopeptide repeat protein 37 isoform X1 [Adelges cooleyi]|uniref:tetratricopeptide repeat protein 37 isoform X1 n=1 Tax=Adelges cooleyi TaxID=133065 RepID=UPI00217FE5CD|nr:tetratricopeptide repeat protein 37 isoform X1 [Adelges cooleyi]XP_050436394.1 tetratricopeptide repeat protein 37 isoform X1 [Adelges cooleyi]